MVVMVGIAWGLVFPPFGVLNLKKGGERKERGEQKLPPPGCFLSLGWL